jgi:hypothetical protein
MSEDFVDGPVLAGPPDPEAAEMVNAGVAAPELVVVPELAFVPEAVDIPDLKVTYPPDLVVLPDLVIAPELVALPELTVLPELVAPPDLVASPQLVVSPEPVTSPELSGPRRSVRAGRIFAGVGLTAALVVIASALVGASAQWASPPRAGRALGPAAWWNRSMPTAVQLPGADRVATAVFAPDGRTLAAADPTGRIQLWDTGSGRRGFTLAGPIGLRQVRFSPDGRRVSAVGTDDAVHSWDPATGQAQAPIVGARAGYFPVGHALVTGDVAGQVRVWGSVVRSAPVLVLKDSPVVDLAVSPDAHTVAVRTEDGVTRVRDLIGERLLTLPTEGRGPLAFSPDGRTLTTGSDVIADAATGPPISGPVRVQTIQNWDAATGHLRSARVVAARRSLPGIVFSPDGRTVATVARADGVVQIEDAATGRLVHELAGLQDEAAAVLSPDGRSLATGNRRCVRVWDLATGKVRLSLPSGRVGPVPTLTFSPDGRVLAVLRPDADLQLWALP